MSLAGSEFSLLKVLSLYSTRPRLEWALEFRFHFFIEFRTVPVP